MSQIYTNAVLTIINAVQGSSTSGIFHDRDCYGNGTFEGPACNLPWKRVASEVDPTSHRHTDLGLETIHVRSGAQSRSDWAGPDPGNSVWATRGWTMQEELLSWRTLTFMRKELLWGCPSIQVWESGKLRVASVDFSRSYETQTVQRVKPNLGHFGLTEMEHESASSSSLITGLRTLNTLEIYSAWYSTLENYSKRKLTKDTDRLMAIAGLAKDVQGFITDNYCAGLWENDLIIGLAWTFDAESWSDTLDIVDPITNRPSWTWGGLKPNSDSRLPSWSWASINNEVEWRFKREIRTNNGGNDNDNSKTIERYIELARIEKMKLVYGLGSRYGPIDSCELVIAAPSYSWSTIDEECAQTWPKFHALLIHELEINPEFQARHKDHPNQTFLVQQLLRIDNIGGKLEEGIDYIPRTNRTFLILETVGKQELGTLSAEGGKIYRRVSMLFLDNMTRDMTVIEPAWPVKRARIV
ncbi:hypothetical protein EG329_004680 [Mollisiaceae sp. DMI_Dod_QoI]|nr:hypothetical protein EG329_004680 [Helotiales sp. DMI_Dod_QoI]